MKAFPYRALSPAAAIAISWSAVLVDPSAAAVAAGPAPAAASPLTRTADGKPDLGGYWSLNPQGPRPALAGAGPPGAPPGPGDEVVAVGDYRNGDISNLVNDGVPRRRISDNLPLYKPEHWERVLELDLNGNLEDSYNHCMPMGIPRSGGPSRIVQTGAELFFFYSVPFQHNQFRMIPFGPRRHPIDRDGTWLGDPVASWEGDTLVVVTEGFNDQTWIGPEGFFHGYELKITERFRPDGGGRLIYDVTVEDPEVLQRPWVLATRTLSRNTNPDFRLEEAAPCSERDSEHLVGRVREM